ncbi:protein WVD2-like 5 isoform X3 [Vigna radiata var. radiata]|uniref:Protein WVD2-like 5 isoform X3 n=1 Tax=Vigna radiata var. radiata TaxID=3916 RepID=A0A3Q0F2K2_VIGRR|nr:protein WVD2-like 5 isoform X3 [Vigna radiata var. radiata]
MDPINLLPADGVGVVHQNGVHDEPSNSGEDGGAPYDLDPSLTETAETVASNGNFDNFHQSESAAIDNSFVAEIKESNDIADGNNVIITKEEDTKISDQTKQSRAPKGLVKNKNAKAPSSSGVHASLVNKSKIGKEKEASSSVSNGTLALDSRPKQSIKSSRLFNDRQTQLSKPKHSLKSDEASSEVSMEKTKPKSLRKGPVKDQGEEDSSLSTNNEDAKPQRVGTLPNYGFSFKCGERAERRKEFYNKLEERIQAKEAEKSNLQAKTKETQDAEIKKLRKSLNFKATPMPSFYQEPAPPKIPTTRPKSPKFGRKKSSANSESDGNTSSSSRLARLSLDEKVSESNPGKGPNPVLQKKPLRRSLPSRLTSEKNNVSKSKATKDEKSSLSRAAKKNINISSATGEEKTDVIAATEEKNILSSETGDAVPLNMVPSDNKPSEEEDSHVNVDIAVEENPLPPLAQEAVATEQ